MNEIATLTVLFDNPLQNHELRQFRGAVNTLLERRELLFHNHTDSGLRYAYPLIQYKCIKGRAAIVCIGDGVSSIHRLLETESLDCNIGDRRVRLVPDSLQHHQTAIEPMAEPRLYRLRRWLPLNADNWRRWCDTPSLPERMAMLEHILTGNLLSMLKGLNIFLDRHIEVHLTAITAQRVTRDKGVQLTEMDIEFTCGLRLPEYIGLGKSASVGHGTLTEVRHPNGIASPRESHQHSYTRQTTEQSKVFLLGGHDLEMLTIKQLLDGRSDCMVFDKRLQWDNARLSAYASHIERHKQQEIYGIELREDIPTPDNYHAIDHHNALSGNPSALEQVAQLLGVSLNRHQQLVAANDKGYIPAMQALSATDAEIAEIRQHDRAAQGVSVEDELMAIQSIDESRTQHGPLTVVRSKTPHFSPICDRLYPYRSLLIYNDTEWMFYGEGAEDIVSHYANEIEQGKMFHGGGANGYVGTARNAFDKDGILQFVNQTIQHYEHL